MNVTEVVVALLASIPGMLTGIAMIMQSRRADARSSERHEITQAQVSRVLGVAQQTEQKVAQLGDSLDADKR